MRSRSPSTRGLPASRDDLPQRQRLRLREQPEGTRREAPAHPAPAGRTGRRPARAVIRAHLQAGHAPAPNVPQAFQQLQPTLPRTAVQQIERAPGQRHEVVDRQGERASRRRQVEALQPLAQQIEQPPRLPLRRASPSEKRLGGRTAWSSRQSSRWAPSCRPARKPASSCTRRRPGRAGLRPRRSRPAAPAAPGRWQGCEEQAGSGAAPSSGPASRESPPHPPGEPGRGMTSSSPSRRRPRRAGHGAPGHPAAAPASAGRPAGARARRDRPPRRTPRRGETQRASGVGARKETARSPARRAPTRPARSGRKAAEQAALRPTSSSRRPARAQLRRELEGQAARRAGPRSRYRGRAHDLPARRTGPCPRRQPGQHAAATGSPVGEAHHGLPSRIRRSPAECRWRSRADRGAAPGNGGRPAHAAPFHASQSARKGTGRQGPAGPPRTEPDRPCPPAARRLSTSTSQRRRSLHREPQGCREARRAAGARTERRARRRPRGQLQPARIVGRSPPARASTRSGPRSAGLLHRQNAPPAVPGRTTAGAPGVSPGRQCRSHKAAARATKAITPSRPSCARDGISSCRPPAPGPVDRISYRAPATAAGEQTVQLRSRGKPDGAPTRPVAAARRRRTAREWPLS